MSFLKDFHLHAHETTRKTNTTTEFGSFKQQLIVYLSFGVTTVFF